MPKKINFTQEQIQEIIRLYVNEKLSSVKIGKLFNVSYRSILNKLRNHKVKIKDSIPPRALNKEQVKEVIKLYQDTKLSLPVIGKRFKVSTPTIAKYLKLNNIKSHATSKYSINDNYFNKINTKDKAFVLGILFADGCNHSNSNEISINLQEQDKRILEKINKKIETNRPLYFVKKNKKGRNQYKLSIYNKKISQDLYRSGMVPRKSLILEFPDFLSDDLLASFIRGFMEGDGCIHINKRKNSSIVIVSSKFFINRLNEIIKEKFNISCTKYKLKKANKNTLYLAIGGNKQVERFLDWIYEDIYEKINDLFLERKYKKYLEIKEIRRKVEENILKNKNRVCQIEGCNNKHGAKGFCYKHYEYNKYQQRKLKKT